jgi:PBP1b-binding outer membrane lipoprotein LpoB
MSRRLPTAALSLLILAGCGHSTTQPGNQTAEAPANTISTIDENAADASLANIVDVTPGDNDSPPAEANGQ